MTLKTDAERAFAQAISSPTFCNPFLPERIEAERAALGPGFVAAGPVWHARPTEEDSPNISVLDARVETVANDLRGRLAFGTKPATLSSLLTDAVDDEIIDTNPALQVGRKKRRAGTLSSADRVQKIGPMTWE